MENASKALLIAAAVLVVIILITVGIKVYTSSSETGKVAENTKKTVSDKTSDATDLATYEITGKKSINYLGKTKETVQPGDDIKIGSERFKVFSKTSTEIKAMPYYNLNINETPIKQLKDTGESLETANVDLPPYISGSTINSIIDKYAEFLCCDEIQLKLAELNDINQSTDNTYLNPTRGHSFWINYKIRQRYSINEYYIDKDGNLTYAYLSSGSSPVYLCVRPIIIIPI